MTRTLHIAFAKAMLVCCLLTAQNAVHAQNDTTHTPVKTIGLVVGGAAFYGFGISYEQSFLHNTAAPMKRYAYWHACVGGANFYEPYILPTIGAGYTHAVSSSNRFYIGAGINGGVLINLDPTPKAQRDYWDSIGFYGSEYINPTEFVLIPEVNIGYLGDHWFLRLQYTPLWVTNRIDTTEINFGHWAGITTGYRFNHSTRS